MKNRYAILAGAALAVLVCQPAIAQIAQTGACSFNPPYPCLQMEPQQCILRGGTFLDGPCTLPCFQYKAYGVKSGVALPMGGGISGKEAIQPTGYRITTSSGQVVADTGAPQLVPMSLPQLDYSLVVNGQVVPGANTNTYLVGPLSTLVNYQSYVVKVSGIDGYGRTTDCTTGAGVVVGGNIAFPPSGLASSVGASGVTFTWTAPDPNRYLVTGYNVKAGSAGAGPFTTVLANGVTGPSTTVPIAALAGLTSYVVVASANPAGEGAPTAPLTIALPPLAPTGLRASPSSDSIALTWAASQGATSYSVLYSKINGGPYTSAGTTASASLYVTGLVRGTTYYFVVVANGPTGASPKSAQLTAATSRVLM